MNEPTHSIEEIQDGVQRLINSHFHQEPSARMRIPASRDDDDLMVSDAIRELAALRAWRAEREAISDPDVNAAREALRSLTVFTQRSGTDTTTVNLSEAGDRIAVVIEAYVDQLLWRARFEPLLRAMAGVPDDAYTEQCPFCHESPGYTSIRHASDCPITKARVLLGEGGQG